VSFIPNDVIILAVVRKCWLSWFEVDNWVYRVYCEMLWRTVQRKKI